MTPLCVLFYHRVADTHPNSWTISNRQFSRQIHWLSEHVKLVSLDEIQRRMRSGKNQELAACITFDDGYAENCQRAIPLLLERQIPCTYFVALDFILSRRAFPHDEHAGQRLEPNTLTQLREMSRAGIEIGAHTRNHLDLGQVTDPDRIYDEIVTATAELAEQIEQPIRYFAFPFGQPENLNQVAARMAREAGIQGVCSAYGAYNLPGDDPFHIRRIHGDPEFARLRNWLTVCPRKLRMSGTHQLPAWAEEELQPA